MCSHIMNKIRVKYAIAFIGVALSLLVIVIVDLILVHSVRDRMTEFSGTFNAAISAVLNADRDLYQARVAELEYLQVEADSGRAQALRENYEENARQAYDRMHEFTQRLAAYPEITGRLDGFETLFSTWSAQSSGVLSLHATGNTEAAREQLEGNSLAAFDRLRDVYNEAGELADAKVVELETLTLSRIRKQQFGVLGFSLLVFLAAVAIALIGPMLMAQAIRQITGRIREITEGDGDLTARIVSRRKDELGELAEQFNAFILRIDRTLQTVRSSTLNVHNAANEIAKSSQELASRTEQTAANLQETSASMEEITTTVSNTSDATQQANQWVQETVGVARRGQEAMTHVENTMDDISRSAAQIDEFIGLIDSITFQTNILALNASVEAARAGEHGRGFAVVAQEVRTLASRSSDASRGIRELIDTSVSRTQSGASLVKSTGRTMQEIVASIERITGVIGEISAGAKEQSQGIAQVNIAVSELDNMTQHNASLVEQTSAAAAEMREQAEHLNDLIASFRLSEVDDTGRILPSTPALPKPHSVSPRLTQALPAT